MTYDFLFDPKLVRANMTTEVGWPSVLGILTGWKTRYDGVDISSVSHNGFGYKSCHSGDLHISSFYVRFMLYCARFQ